MAVFKKEIMITECENGFVVSSRRKDIPPAMAKFILCSTPGAVTALITSILTEEKIPTKGVPF